MGFDRAQPYRKEGSKPRGQVFANPTGSYCFFGLFVSVDVCIFYSRVSFRFQIPGSNRFPFRPNALTI